MKTLKIVATLLAIILVGIGVIGLAHGYNKLVCTFIIATSLAAFGLLTTPANGAAFVFIVVLALTLSSCSNIIIGENKIIRLAEYAYFEGQRDALTGDVRIKRTVDSCYVWTKSPWDDGQMPLFHPICEVDK